MCDWYLKTTFSDFTPHQMKHTPAVRPKKFKTQLKKYSRIKNFPSIMIHIGKHSHLKKLSNSNYSYINSNYP